MKSITEAEQAQLDNIRYQLVDLTRSIAKRRGIKDPEIVEQEDPHDPLSAMVAASKRIFFDQRSAKNQTRDLKFRLSIYWVQFQNN